MRKAILPDTSLAAWRSITKEQLSDHHAKILSALRELNSASAEQIASRIKLTHLQVTRRMSELERLELIYKPGSRVATSTGRSAFCWQLRNPNEVPEKITERALPGKSVADYARNISKPIQPELF